MAPHERVAPYDPSRKALYFPGRATDFFDSPRTWKGVALCAELSRLSYCDDSDQRRKSLAKASLEECVFLDVGGTQALIAIDKDRAYFAFRGTDGPEALLDDLKTLRDVSWEKGGRVHHGFADYFNRVRQPVTDVVEEMRARPIVFTGHSLGAAAATLAESLWPRATLCTFGSPRVGDAAFAATIPADRAERFVDCCDAVSRVPLEAWGYRHVGPLRYITRDGALEPEITPEAIAVDRRSGRRAYWRHAARFWKNVLSRDLADHAPVNYAAVL